MAKILVVDDTYEILKLVTAQLEHFGHNVIPCMNGHDALNILAQEHCDLLLTDHVMPGITGIELAKRVQQEYPQVAVIIMSATLAYDETLPCRILKKPDDITIDPLKAAIDESLKC